MYKLLVADDEPKIRNGICNYFPWNDSGFEVVYEAKNGKQALEYVQTNPVDVIISDIKMPVMSGIDLARELYNSKSKIKIVLLSGYKDFEFAQQALIYGVKNYILKPTKYNELLKVFTIIKSELDLENSEQIITKNSDEAQHELSQSQGFHDKIISIIKAYINENYKDATLQDIADLVHLNFFYLSKFFKSKTGQNFSDYLISVKMEKAAELLININYKIYEVGIMVGYNNSKNFTRAFRRYFGKSPKEYREHIM